MKLLDGKLTATFDKNLLGGLMAIRGAGVTAIPYLAWNNGKAGMAVWIPY